MSDGLATYLHDHLAGATVAINLLDALQAEHADESLGGFAAELRAEIENEREVLRALAERVSTRGNPLKEATAWIAEKVGRLKLGRAVAGELGTFEALEGLSLGILGKRALWSALARVAEGDERLCGVDYDGLIARAEVQHAAVDEWRLDLAPAALLHMGDADEEDTGPSPHQPV